MTTAKPSMRAAKSPAKPAPPDPTELAVDWERFCQDFDVAAVVLSRNRADVLAKRTDRLVHGYHLFHAGPGYDDYEYNCVERHSVPEGIVGLARVRNHVLREMKQEWIIFLDDDYLRIRYVLGPQSIDLDPTGVQLMLLDLVVNAIDLGAYVFGIGEVDIRKASPLITARHRAVVGGLVGVRGRGQWFDERNQLKTDYDFCLQSMRDHRLLLKDQRYFLEQDRNRLPGGNMELRTRQREEAEVANLVRWWGDDVITWKAKKSTIGLSVRVP